MRGDKIKRRPANGGDGREGDGEDAFVGDLGEETQAVGAEHLTGHTEGDEQREAVELALTELVRIRKQADVKKLRGLFHWEGDLEKMRLDR